MINEFWFRVSFQQHLLHKYTWDTVNLMAYRLNKREGMVRPEYE